MDDHYGLDFDEQHQQWPLKKKVGSLCLYNKFVLFAGLLLVVRTSVGVNALQVTRVT